MIPFIVGLPTLKEILRDRKSKNFNKHNRSYVKHKSLGYSLIRLVVNLFFIHHEVFSSQIGKSAVLDFYYLGKNIMTAWIL